MLSDYPAPVAETLENAAQVLSEPGGFFDEYNIPHKRGAELFVELAGPDMLKSWLDTGEIEVPDDDTFHKYLVRVITESHLIDLKEAGLVDCIEDEHGEEHFWLTSDGKQLAEIAKYFEK
jgi:hypothetical protein